MSSYRMNGLNRHAEEIAEELKDSGLLGAEIEIIGAILYTKYKGDSNKLDKLQADMFATMNEAEALLKSLEEMNDDDYSSLDDREYSDEELGNDFL